MSNIKFKKAKKILTYISVITILFAIFVLSGGIWFANYYAKLLGIL